jgi:adenosylmethionine-8-amino-7-oxononanoate aminotransferase
MTDLLHLDKKNIWHPFTPLQSADAPIFVERASGVYLHTQDGRSIIDAVSSWWVNLHGHSNPHIAEAIAQQARQLEHVIFAGFTHAPAILLSENLMKILPKNQERIFFSDNGSTAVEVGLKMAFQYWHNQDIIKKNVIAIQGAYHGDTFGSMSVGERGLFTDPFSPFLFNTQFIDFPGKDHASETLAQFKKLVDHGDVAAFIFEPLLQGAGGMRMYSSSVLESMIRYAQEHDVICIADEVLTGFGRTGRTFAVDHLECKPDIMALSKGLTGGTLPMGITTCNQKILSVFDTSDFSKTFFHGHSYTANPLACAAANASFELLTSVECQQNISRIMHQQAQFVNKLNRHNMLRRIESLGTVVALELNTDEITSYTSETRKRIYRYFLDRNILLRPLGNILYILPPYVITEKELHYVQNTIEEFLAEI